MTKAQALALARALNLRRADVPSAYSASAPQSSSAGEKAISRRLSACAGGAREADRLAEASSDTFKRQANGLPQEVSSNVSVERSPASVQQDLTAIRSSRGVACLSRFVNSMLAGKKVPGATIGKASIAQGTPPQAHTDGSVGLRVTVPFNVHGITLRLYIDLLGFAHGPEEVTLSSLGIGEPVAAATQQRLFTLLVHRASARAV